MIFVNTEQILIRNNDPEYTIVNVDEGVLMSFEDCKKKITHANKELFKKSKKPNDKYKKLFNSIV